MRKIIMFFAIFLAICFSVHAQENYITGTDNGYKWQKVSYEAKANLCKDIARRIGNYDWEYYYKSIDSFYKTANPNILNQTIASIAGIFSVIPSDEQKTKYLIDALNEGLLDKQELEIYKFLHDRWDFYEQRDGTYVPEKHDAIVLDEAALKFGKDKNAIDKINWKVANIEAGVKPKPQIKLSEESVPVEIEIKNARLIKNNIIEVTVENKTAKDIVLPAININCLLFKGSIPVGYSCGITIWIDNLGYKETKSYESAPLSFDFDTLKITGYINIDAMKTKKLKSSIQTANDPGETVIPVLKSGYLRLSSIYRIEGILFDKIKPIVIIHGQSYFVGNSVIGFKITDVSPDSIIVEQEGKSKILKIGDSL